MSPDDRVCFTCGCVDDIDVMTLIKEGYECYTCSENNRTDYENKRWGGDENE